jgi:RNA polymerase sigma-70 factor (ECF subfamily)
VERYFDGLLRFFTTKAGDRADDLVQVTFLRCAEVASTYRGECSARSFLFGIARNVLFEHIRGKVRDGSRPANFDTASIADLAPSATQELARASEQRRLILALQSLPVELQVTVELFYWEGLSVDELAAATDVPPGTVKSRLHRVRGLLRAAIEEQREDPQGRGFTTLVEDWLQRLSASETLPE